MQEAPLCDSIALALLRPECSAILVLFDGDDDCPKELAPRIEEWAKAAAGQVPCAVVVAQREYAAWFIASIESLRGERGIRDDAEPHPNPETPRGAKGQLEMLMVPGAAYSPTADQAALTAKFDMAIAHARCRSFRRMVRAFGLLTAGAGAPLDRWPPPGWVTE
ncbi:MAG TPA: DUF4276 family protein [Blastocatellia bacterium]|nr:DUF4276 family protein [Blastocatellia bacterium]